MDTIAFFGDVAAAPTAPAQPVLVEILTRPCAVPLGSVARRSIRRYLPSMRC